METVYRLFMYILPYALCIIAYVWVFKRALRVPNKIAKAIALVIVVAGFAYTVYRIIQSVSTALTNDNFEFVILIVTAFVLFFASIAIAIGEPEK